MGDQSDCRLETIAEHVGKRKVKKLFEPFRSKTRFLPTRAARQTKCSDDCQTDKVFRRLPDRQSVQTTARQTKCSDDCQTDKVFR
ncbi:hypothetical protein ACF0H5_008623 [Mactra antiquata]